MFQERSVIQSLKKKCSKTTQTKHTKKSPKPAAEERGKPRSTTCICPSIRNNPVHCRYNDQNPTAAKGGCRAQALEQDGGRWCKVTVCKSELLISSLSCIIPDRLFTPGKKKGKSLRSCHWPVPTLQRSAFCRLFGNLHSIPNAPSQLWRFYHLTFPSTAWVEMGLSPGFLQK